MLYLQWYDWSYNLTILNKFENYFRSVKFSPHLENPTNILIILQSSLKFPNLRVSHAGRYVCQANSTTDQTEYAIAVGVTGVVPKFIQAPVSYMELEALDNDIKFDIDLSFKPEKANGLLLYGAESNLPGADFISFGLLQGVPQFRFGLGWRKVVIAAKKPITFDKWHTVRLSRNGLKGSMTIDNELPLEDQVRGRQVTIDMRTPLYLGGVPKSVQAFQNTEIDNGFVGNYKDLCFNNFISCLPNNRMIFLHH